MEEEEEVWGLGLLQLLCMSSCCPLPLCRPCVPAASPAPRADHALGTLGARHGGGVAPGALLSFEPSAPVPGPNPGLHPAFHASGVQGVSHSSAIVRHTPGHATPQARRPVRAWCWTSSRQAEEWSAVPPLIVGGLSCTHALPRRMVPSPHPTPLHPAHTPCHSPYGQRRSRVWDGHGWARTATMGSMKGGRFLVLACVPQLWACRTGRGHSWDCWTLCSAALKCDPNPCACYHGSVSRGVGHGGCGCPVVALGGGGWRCARLPEIGGNGARNRTRLSCFPGIIEVLPTQYQNGTLNCKPATSWVAGAGPPPVCRARPTCPLFTPQIYLDYVHLLLPRGWGWRLGFVGRGSPSPALSPLQRPPTRLTPCAVEAWAVQALQDPGLRLFWASKM